MQATKTESSVVHRCQQCGLTITVGPLPKKDTYMPTETAIIIACIVLAFAVFAVSLAWADYYTRNVRVPGAVYFNERGSKE